MTLATSTDLARLMQRDLSAEEQETADLVLELVAGEVTLETGQTFAGGTETVRLAGVWGADLELPRRPVTAVVSVAVDGVALADADYLWNGGQLLRLGGQLGDHYYGGTWGGPGVVVTVTYTTSAEVPAGVKSIVLQAAARAMNPTAGVKQETVGAYSVTYTDNGGTAGILTAAERKALRRIVGRNGGTIDAGVR